jgi:putative transposase
MRYTYGEELACRRKAIRLTLKGLRPRDILTQLSRSRTWLFTWQTRFAQMGWDGLKDLPRRPRQSPHAYDRTARAVVLRLRRSLQSRRLGLIGARSIRREILDHHLLRQVPALTTINRWLKAAGLISSPPPAARAVYYPAPGWRRGARLQAMDWTARYLEGGGKVFAFHTIEAATRALAQTISGDKSKASLLRHVRQVWQTLGLPDLLQLDNDAAFNGGQKTARRFGHFVRLSLFLGIELIFVPPAEPKRNWLVEGLNGLWARSFWDRDRFTSLAEVEAKSQQFRQWYAGSYQPPALNGLTPQQAQGREKRRRLTKRQIGSLPESLPITAGRVHFIRRVSEDGEISLLGERWRVGKRLAHEYVWATVITHCRRLEIYHQRSERSRRRRVKTYAFEIGETVRRLRSEFRR